jgi:hypothetical protein
MHTLTLVALTEDLRKVEHMLDGIAPKLSFKCEFHRATSGDWRQLEEVTCDDDLFHPSEKSKKETSG